VVQVLPYDESVLTSDAETLKAAMAAASDDGTCTLYHHEQTEVDGYPTLYVDYALTANGVAQHSRSYYLMADKIYVFTLTDCTEGDAWQEAFDQAVTTIDLLCAGDTVAPPPTEGLTRYEYAGHGLAFAAQAGFEEQDKMGVQAYLIRDDTLIRLSGGQTSWTKEEYGKDMQRLTPAIPDFETDLYGNYRSILRTVDEDGQGWMNMIVLMEDADRGWVWNMQMICTEEASLYYEDLFAQWATTVEWFEPVIENNGFID